MNMNAISSGLKTAAKPQAGGQTKAVPYSLKDGNVTSAHYYSDIAAFADRWSASLHPWLDKTVDRVQEQRHAAGLAERTFDELALELLALGVMLREYGAPAAHLPTWGQKILGALIQFQNQYPCYEGLFKTLRGAVNGLFDPRRGEADRSSDPARLVRSLVTWLRLQGAEAQANRLEEWLPCFDQGGARTAAALLSTSLDLAARFATLSEANLGNYTRAVEAYRKGVLPSARWRYDGVLVSSTPLEYHLGMLGTEILNRAYRAGFQAARHKLVILPPCLCARPQGKCLAIQTPMGKQCGGCTPACRVNQVTKAAAQKGVRVAIIPDDQLSSLCLASGQAGSGLGVLGAACALRNWSAGWEANRLGLNAHGVLLDSASCGKHWMDKGLATDVNMQELLGQL